MRHIVGAACGLWLCLVAPALAQDDAPSGQGSGQGVLVELYTSQGCSSCPPADEFLSELSQANGVIALSLHVDYWDYIGWEDEFADPKFTERQQRYARVAGSRMVYTPQMVIGGVDRVAGHSPDMVVQAIGRHLAKDSPVDLTLFRRGDQVEIRAHANVPLEKGAIVQLVRYMPEAVVNIQRGENAGRRMVYTNVVRSWSRVGEWQGLAPLELRADAPGSDPVVVIVQEPGPAAVLAAARLD